jgi:uncharacterized protein YceH (UPF0502 family)
LPRAPGARESRYAHLFSGHLESVEEPAAAEESGSGTATLGQRVEQLEERVRRLQEEMAALSTAVPAPTAD